MATIIDVEEGIQEMFIGETIKFTINTKGATSGEGVDATPSAIGTAEFWFGSSTATSQMSGSASIATDVITTKSMIPTSAGMYSYLQPMTVNSNTLIQRIRILVKDASP